MVDPSICFFVVKCIDLAILLSVHPSTYPYYHKAVLMIFVGRHFKLIRESTAKEQAGQKRKFKLKRQQKRAQEVR